MPLYMVKVSVPEVTRVIRPTGTAVIPVSAENEAEALAYVQSTNEWIEDESVQTLDPELYLENNHGVPFTEIETAVTAVGVELVTDPSLTPWEGDCLCWNKGDDTSVAEALYGNPSPGPEGDWDGWLAREEELIARYDAARN